MVRAVEPSLSFISGKILCHYFKIAGKKNKNYQEKRETFITILKQNIFLGKLEMYPKYDTWPPSLKILSVEATRTSQQQSKQNTLSEMPLTSAYTLALENYIVDDLRDMGSATFSLKQL